MRKYFYRVLKVEKKAEQLSKKFISNENFTPIESTSEDDIFIASYPKSGVTWLQNLITGMILNSASENITPKLVNEIVPDIHAKNYYKRLFPHMFFKTHFLPQKKYKKVIHLVRDGRDSLISYHHYLKLNGKNGPNLEEMIKQGKGLWPSKWYEHTEAWVSNSFNAEILTIRYEDLKNNHLQELKKIAEFSSIRIEDEMLLRIWKNNKIGTLRSKVAKNGWDYDKAFGKDSPKFFRRGAIGDYKNEMDGELIQFFNKESEKMLKKFGYEV